MDEIEIEKLGEKGYAIKIKNEGKNILINPPKQQEIKREYQEDAEITTIVQTDPKTIENAKTWENTPILTKKQIKLKKEEDPRIININEEEVYWLDDNKAVAILPNKNAFLKIGPIKILYIFKEPPEQEDDTYIDIALLTEQQQEEKLSKNKIHPQITITPEIEKIKIMRHLTQIHIKEIKKQKPQKT